MAHNSGRGEDKWLRRGRGESDGFSARAFRFKDGRMVSDWGECIRCGACAVGCSQRTLRLVRMWDGNLLKFLQYPYFPLKVQAARICEIPRAVSIMLIYF